MPSLRLPNSSARLLITLSAFQKVENVLGLFPTSKALDYGPAFDLLLQVRGKESSIPKLLRYLRLSWAKPRVDPCVTFSL